MIGGVSDPVGRAQDQLRQLFPGQNGLDNAVAWATDVLAQELLDPAITPLRAARALRRTDRRLALVTARYLTEAAAGSKQKRSRTPLNPHLE
ncbi:hypothetical protein GCM10023160_25220 [Brachybacterium paraconglomeratum]